MQKLEIFEIFDREEENFYFHFLIVANFVRFLEFRPAKQISKIPLLSILSRGKITP